MNKLGPFLAKPAVLAAIAVLFAAFLGIGYPRMGALFSAATPEGGAFDLEFFYSPNQAIEKAALYTDRERADAVRVHWTLDLAFPLLYGTFLSSAWAFCLKRLASPASRPPYAPAALPLAAMALDLAENAAVSILLAAGSGAGNGELGAGARAAAAAASVATPAKWIFVAASMAGAIILAVLTAAAAVRRRARADR